jgi:hypothetical protein
VYTDETFVRTPVPLGQGHLSLDHDEEVATNVTFAVEHIASLSRPAFAALGQGFDLGFAQPRERPVEIWRLNRIGALSHRSSRLSAGVDEREGYPLAGCDKPPASIILDGQGSGRAARQQ